MLLRQSAVRSHVFICARVRVALFSMLFNTAAAATLLITAAGFVRFLVSMLLRTTAVCSLLLLQVLLTLLRHLLRRVSKPGVLSIAVGIRFQFVPALLPVLLLS